MTEESWVSRTPRTWTAGDDEPEDGTRVRDALGGEWVRRGRLWHSKIDPRLWSWVLIRGPLVEVLPDAPEPQPEGCCGACRGKGGDQDGPCSDCLSSGHAHDPDDPCPGSESKLIEDTKGIAERCYFEGCPKWITGSSDYCPQHAAECAPESVAGVFSVSPEGETTPGEGERLTEALRAQLAPIRDFIVGQVGFDAGEGMTVQATELRDALLAAGWRPPQPDSETEWGCRWPNTKEDQP